MEGLFVETKPDRFYKFANSNSSNPPINSRPKATVYPNPTAGNIIFLRENTNPSEGDFIITDLVGQVLLSAPIAKNQNVFEADVNFLHSGVYLWTFISKNFKSSGKFIKINQ